MAAAVSSVFPLSQTTHHRRASPPRPFHSVSRIRFPPGPRRNITETSSPLAYSSPYAAASPTPITSTSSPSSSSIEALIFDCDGVILESEHLHRQAYNYAFLHFNVRCPSSDGPLSWSSHFYDELQNRIGGGKPKMRWYFGEHGWPSSSILPVPPSDDDGKARLIDTIQKLSADNKHCLVVEDSYIGLRAATQAGMPCIISYTSPTANQDFKDAVATFPHLGNVRLQELELLLQNVMVSK